MKVSREVPRANKPTFAPCKPLWAIFAAIAALLAAVAAGTSSAQSFGDGVKGWGTVPGPAPGQFSFFASAQEACKWQYDHYKPVGQPSWFIGYKDTAYYWSNKLCDWYPHGPGISPNPASALFQCDYGYTPVEPGLCLKDNIPTTDPCSSNNGALPNPKSAHPVEILTGSKILTREDFQTADGSLSLGRWFTSGGYAGLPVSYYNTRLPASFANWRASWSLQITISEFNIISNRWVVTLPSGRAVTFQRSGGTFTPYSNITYPIPATDVKLAYVGTYPSSANYATFVASSSTWTVTDEQDRVWTLQTYLDPQSGVYNIAVPTSMVDRTGLVRTFTYGSSGELTSISDSAGKTVTLSWLYSDPSTVGISGRPKVPVAISRIDLPDGSDINYSYETSVANPDGLVRPDRLVLVEYRDASDVVKEAEKYLYDDTRFPTFVTGIKDKDDVLRWKITYDASARVSDSEGPTGEFRDHVAYGVFGSTFTRTVTNALGKDTVYQFAKVNATDAKLTGVNGQASTHCPASTSSLAYNTSVMLTSTTDEEGRVTAYTRNTRGLPTQIVEAQGTSSARTTNITWHATFTVPTQVAETGRTTDYVYDTTGRLTSKTETDTTTFTTPYSTNGRTRTWAYTYDTGGRLLTVDGPLSGASDTVTYSYNSSGYLATVTNQVGQVTTVFAWDGRGQPTTVVDPNGVSATLAYDVRGRPLTVTVNPGAAQSEYQIEYNAVGDVSKITFPRGAYLIYTYDDARRLTVVTNDRGETQNFTNNLAGEPTARVIKSSGSTITAQQTQAYDELGRIIQVVGAGSQTWSFGYDKVDNPTSETDARSKVWQTAFDPLNRVITETNPQSQTVQQAYNGQDELTSFTDGRSLQTTRVVDGFGFTIQEVSPDRGTRTMWYDAAGRLTQLTDGDGQQVNYAYDDADRLLSSAYAGASAETVTYSYDSTTSGNKGVGRLTGVTEQSGSTSLVYDAQGRVTQEGRVIQSQTYGLAYAYDTNGDITEITLPSGRTVTYTRADDGLITGVTTKATPVSSPETLASSVVHKPFGPLQSLTYGNGLALTRTYDGNYWLSQIEVKASGGTALDLSFGRNANGQLDSVTDNASSGRAATYGYTDSGRLSAATGAWGADAYTYDAAGNRTDQARTIGGTTTHVASIVASASNRVSQVQDGASNPVRNLTYRTGGDLSQDAYVSGSAYAYTYNARKRLVLAKKDAVDAGAYGYDYLGRRVWRTIYGGTTVNSHYVFDRRGHLLAEHNGSTAAVVREYVWVDDLPIAMIDSSGTYFIHTGQIDEPLVMTNASKAKIWDAAIEPYGTAVMFGTPSAGLDLRLSGQWLQAETGGLFQNWHRDYDPSLGRYVEIDPLGINGGGNLYAYAHGNPVYFSDPTGEVPVVVGLALMGAATGAGGNLIGQLVSNGGRWECVSVKEVLIAGAFGGAVGALMPSMGLYALDAAAVGAAANTAQYAMTADRPTLGGMAFAGAAGFLGGGLTGRFSRGGLTFDTSSRFLNPSIARALNRQKALQRNTGANSVLQGLAVSSVSNVSPKQCGC